MTGKGKGEGGRGAKGLKVKDFDQTEHDHLRAKREKGDGGREGGGGEEAVLKLQHDKLTPSHSLDIVAVVKQPLL